MSLVCIGGNLSVIIVDGDWNDTWDEFFIRGEASDTIENVKAKIEDQEGIPFSRQRLACGWRVLENSETLLDLGMLQEVGRSPCFRLYIMEEEEEETDEGEETDEEEEEERGQ